MDQSQVNLVLDLYLVLSDTQINIDTFATANVFCLPIVFISGVVTQSISYLFIKNNSLNG